MCFRVQILFWGESLPSQKLKPVLRLSGVKLVIRNTVYSFVCRRYPLPNNRVAEIFLPLAYHYIPDLRPPSIIVRAGLRIFAIALSSFSHASCNSGGKKVYKR